ncbi:peptidoglycan recognition protein family protein [Pseudoduganella violaceinigra]|uniref:peptidoglycan recognition protein family protein n=1 Tax=Pseudoduganella violaceinigra TaxID=246602 RepID=UPI0004208D2B|nr:N-acetylmuramoyl-L-alanine amidase [Pseudoduganella violaceinigra]
MKKLLLASLIALLTGCATQLPHIDHSLTSKGQSSRVRFVVLHYTVSDLPRSIMLLTEKEVSAHYLITDEEQPRVYALVDENRAAWHAGLSSWKGYTALNSSSIGIEIVNPGFKDEADGRHWYGFSERQVEQLVALLKQIKERHQIAPENFLGHADVAPQRKQDPGPMFPWKRLADEGLIAWPDANAVAAVRPQYEARLPDIAWFQQKLALHGYATPQTGVLDPETHNVLVAFQAKYRNSKWDGVPDAESAAILDVLTAPKPKQ